jgi:hypothetical protein
VVEQVTCNGRPLCYVVRVGYAPESTVFLTPPEFKQQVGFVVYPAGGTIVTHLHMPLERHLIGTSEVLIVKKGRRLLDVHSDEREPVATRELQAGDIMLTNGDGHGFRMLEVTVLLEVKQVPYPGVEEKERFW